MKALLPLNNGAIEGYEEISSQSDHQDELKAKEAPILAAFYSKSDAHALQEELADIVAAGGKVTSQELSGSELANQYPYLNPSVSFAISLLGQRYIDPYKYSISLADEVRALGCELRFGVRALGVEPGHTGATTRLSNGDTIRSDAAVIATGAWTSTLAKSLGVKVSQAAGRGYSFWATSEEKIDHPIYFPAQRIACTPLDSGLRIAGTMEITGTLEAYDPRRVDAIIRSARGLLMGVNLEEREHEWVGPRPITEDGLPLIGPTKSENIWVAAGHGMWGVTHGPITGRLVAQALTSKKVPSILQPFSPLR